MTSGGRTLLVLLDGADNFLSERVTEAVPAGSEVTLLGISQHALCRNRLIDNLKVSEASKLDLSAVMDEVVSHDGAQLADSLSQLHATSPGLWAARFTELNFSDPVWRDYVTARALKQIIENGAGSYDRVILFGGTHLLQAAVQEVSTIPVICFRDLTWANHARSLLEPIRCWVYWLRNGLSEVGAVLAAKWYRYRRSKDTEAEPQVVIYCNYPSNWSDGDRPQYRFTGQMLDFLRPDIAVRYVVSPIHSNTSVVRGVQSTMMACARLRDRDEISILQKYSRIRDVWTSYIMGSDNVKWNLVRKELSRMGFGFVFPRIRRNYKWLDQPKQYALYRAMGRYLDAHPGVSRILVPIFELVEGRAIVLAARERGVEVIGLQHGAAGPWGGWRLISAACALMRAGSCAMPRRIAVEGPLYEKLFRQAGFDRVHVTGASRIRALPDRVGMPISDGRSVILVLLDLHHWRALTDWALHFAELEPTFQVVVRSHPKRRQQVMAYCERKGIASSNFIVDSIPGLTDAVGHHTPHAIVAGETGGVLEFALVGWPCFLFSSGSAPQMSPLAWDCENIRSVTWGSDSISKLVSLVNSRESQLYAKKLRQCAKENVQHYGEMADRSLAFLLRG